MNTWLLNLRDEEIIQAIAAQFDQKLWAKIPSELKCLSFDLDLYEQAIHLQACGFDRMYAQLTWKGPN